MKLGEIANQIRGLDTNKLFTPNQNNIKDDKSFANVLNESLTKVNKTQLEAYNAMEQIATGKVENLQKAVQKIEEAELSLKLALEVKNKALSAYKEVMRMQI